MYLFWLLGVMLLISSGANAQEERSLARKGNQAYQDDAFSEAEVKYRKSLKAASDFNKARYNLANTLVKQERYQQAAKEYKKVIQDTDKKAVKANAYHNMGNALLKAKKIDKSIKAYKNALRLNPGDEDTRYNLSYALKKRQKKQQQRKKQQQKKQDKQQQKKQQNKKDKQKQQADKSGDQQKDKSQQNQRSKDSKQQKAQKTGAKKGKKQQMSKRQMEQILRAIQANEKDLQRKILKKKRKGDPQDDNQKEW